MKQFLITTLAEYQTHFWLDVAFYLQDKGHGVAFISFDDNSTEILKNERFSVTSFSEYFYNIEDHSSEFIDSLIDEYGISDLSYWFTHERMVYGVRDTQYLKNKLAASLLAADKACKELLKRGEVVLLQELGGFLSVIGSYHAGRKNGIDNWFIEPSFFKGHLLFIKNSFSALSFSEGVHDSPSHDLKDYLDKAKKNGTIVIPKKDAHQYSKAWKKIVNAKNAKRLYKKLIDKYYYKKYQEFGHVERYVSLHLNMLLNSIKLKAYYQDLSAIGSFVYYPLHVPGDMALTLRSPQYLDQLALIDFIARSIPHSYQLVIKEHPAMIGAIEAKGIIDLLKRNPNITLLNPAVNNYDVLSKADSIVSVNSKSGAEALLLGKTVLVFGDAFYSKCPLVNYVENLRDFPSMIRQALIKPKNIDLNEKLKYFEAVWRESHSGELYISDKENVDVFCSSILANLMN
jgi:hypothetical protein